MKSTTLPLLALVHLSSVALGQDEGTKEDQRAFYECSDPLRIDSGLFEVQAGRTYFRFNTALAPTGLKAMDFVWLPDAPEGYFTAYLINTSDTTLKAERQDGSLIMIQEALNERGEWLPIEYWVYSGCGNSYFSPLVLEPGYYVMVPVQKYSGNLKTKIRLKWKLGDRKLYSEPFEGSIDPARFQREASNVRGILYHGPASYLED